MIYESFADLMHSYSKGGIRFWNKLTPIPSLELNEIEHFYVFLWT